jgi:hypothetical protein
MALKCGVNSRTYEPTGDGLDPDLHIALMLAVTDYLTSLARVTGKLAVYSAQPCPVGCRPKTIATPDTYTDQVFTAKWQARQKRYHVRIGIKITRTVTCGTVALTPKPKTTKPKTARPKPGTRRNSRRTER